MAHKQAELLLAFVIICRASAMMFSKIALASLSPMNLLAWRFVPAFIIIAVIFHRQLRQASAKAWLHGAILGTGFFATMTFEMWSLKASAATNVALLENTAIIWTPLVIAILARRLPRTQSIFSSVIAFVGVGCLTLSGKGFYISAEDAHALTAAFLYTTVIILTDRFAKENADDVVPMGIIQIGVLGALALVSTPVTGGFSLPVGQEVWLCLAFLIIVCTGFGFTLQPLAQRYVSAERAGLFCGLNPFFAAILAAVFLQERLSLQGYTGLVLILSAVLLPYLAQSVHHFPFKGLKHLKYKTEP